MLFIFITLLSSQVKSINIMSGNSIDRECVQAKCASELQSCQADAGSSGHCLSVLNCVTGGQMSLAVKSKYLPISNCIDGIQSALSMMMSSPIRAITACVQSNDCLTSQASASSFFQLSAKAVDDEPVSSEGADGEAFIQVSADEEPEWKKLQRKTEAQLASVHQQLVEANKQVKHNVEAQKKDLEEIERIKDEQVAHAAASKKALLASLEATVPSFIQTGDVKEQIQALTAKANAALVKAHDGVQNFFRHSSLLQGLADADERGDKAGEFELSSQVPGEVDGSSDNTSIRSFIQLEQFSPAQIQARIDEAMASGKEAAEQSEREIARLSAKMNEDLDHLKSMSMLETQKVVPSPQRSKEKLAKLKKILDEQSANKAKAKKH